MKKKVFSLKSLLLSVLVAAVFIVAFLNSSFVWASIVVTLTLLLLMAAVVSSYLLPQTRPMLVCAAIVGISYGAAAFVSPLGLWDSLVSSILLYDVWYEVNQEELNQYLSRTASSDT